MLYRASGADLRVGGECRCRSRRISRCRLRFTLDGMGTPTSAMSVALWLMKAQHALGNRQRAIMAI